MPHVTLQISPGGPILDVAIGISKLRSDQLLKEGKPIPQNVQIRGLVDTGASCTCIDPSIINQLGISPTGSTEMRTPSTGNTPHTADQYDVSLHLLSPKLSLGLQNVSIVESHLSMQGIQALIGRDILSNCLLVYDGQTGIFSLAF